VAIVAAGAAVFGGRAARRVGPTRNQGISHRGVQLPPGASARAHQRRAGQNRGVLAKEPKVSESYQTIGGYGGSHQHVSARTSVRSSSDEAVGGAYGDALHLTGIMGTGLQRQPAGIHCRRVRVPVQHSTISGFGARPGSTASMTGSQRLVDGAAAREQTRTFSLDAARTRPELANLLPRSTRVPTGKFDLDREKARSRG